MHDHIGPPPRASREVKRHALAAFATQVMPLGEEPGDAAIVDAALWRHATTAPEVVIV